MKIGPTSLLPLVARPDVSDRAIYTGGLDVWFSLFFCFLFRPLSEGAFDPIEVRYFSIAGFACWFAPCLLRPGAVCVCVCHPRGLDDKGTSFFFCCPSWGVSTHVFRQKHVWQATAEGHAYIACRLGGERRFEKSTSPTVVVVVCRGPPGRCVRFCPTSRCPSLSLRDNVSCVSFLDRLSEFTLHTE